MPMVSDALKKGLVDAYTPPGNPSKTANLVATSITTMWSMGAVPFGNTPTNAAALSTPLAADLTKVYTSMYPDSDQVATEVAQAIDKQYATIMTAGAATQTTFMALGLGNLMKKLKEIYKAQYPTAEAAAQAEAEAILDYSLANMVMGTTNTPIPVPVVGSML
jgi:hypothetical protein